MAREGGVMVVKGAGLAGEGLEEGKERVGKDLRRASSEVDVDMRWPEHPELQTLREYFLKHFASKSKPLQSFGVKEPQPESSVILLSNIPYTGLRLGHVQQVRGSSNCYIARGGCML